MVINGISAKLLEELIKVLEELSEIKMIMVQFI
jgi:hypothetical protein